MKILTIFIEVIFLKGHKEFYSDKSSQIKYTTFMMSQRS